MHQKSEQIVHSTIHTTLQILFWNHCNGNKHKNENNNDNINDNNTNNDDTNNNNYNHFFFYYYRVMELCSGGPLYDVLRMQ